MPRYCACCLLSLERASATRRGLELPWCEDCRQHTSMHKLHRGARWGKLVAWALALLLLVASLAPGIHWILWLRGMVITFVFLGMALSALGRLRLEERKESCRASGPPLDVLAHDAAGWTVECASPEYALLLLEANPGAKELSAERAR